MGCDGINMPGPADNINCNGYYDVPFNPGVDGPNPDSRFTYTAGTIYDSYNRNIAVSIGFFKQSASAGIGALINLSDGTLSGVPSEIPGSSIASVPNSDNCAMCHARTNSDTIGLPMEAASYGGMTTGFGNFFRMTPPGGAFDWDKIAANGTCTDCANDTVWSEFGCKTGMGKRSQRAGVGNQDRFGFGLCLGCASFNAMMGDMSTGWWTGMDYIAGNADDGVCGLPSVQAACNAKAGTTLQGSAGQWMGIFENPMTMLPKKITNKLEDTDVHDKAGMKCATCHSMISGDFPSRTIGAYTLPAVSIDRIDHQIAQGWSTLEKANDVIDGTVSCEGCHIDGDHPNAGAAPVPRSCRLSFCSLRED